MKRFYMLLIAVILLGGCTSHRPMDVNEMHTAPDFSGMMPENITVIRLVLNRDLDIADTAMYPDLGISDSTSWPFFLTSLDADNLKAAKLFLAVNVPLPNGGNLPLVYLPGKLEDYKGLGGFMTDHAMKRCYSSTGQMAYLPSWEKVKPSNLKGIINPLSEMATIEAKKGTREYDDLMLLLEPFKAAEEKKYLAAMKIRNDYLTAYGINTGGMLTSEEMKYVTEDEEFVEKMKDLLSDNWFGAVGFPMSAEQFGAFIIVAKVFQIPTKFWAFDIERPGYMDRKLTALQGSAMIDRYDNKYGFKRHISPQDLADFREILAKYRANKKKSAQK